MKPFTLKDYTYEEIQFLKFLATYPDDPNLAAKLINQGESEYNMEYLEKMTEKFLMNGILDFRLPFIVDDTEKARTLFKDDIQEIILNYSNPIPDSIRDNVESGTIIEKLGCSNLDSKEIKYITTLIKNDVLNHL